MSNQTEAILKRFPEAVSAVNGVRVGDVLCNDTDMPLIIVNEATIDNLNNSSKQDKKEALEFWFIIGNADRVAV